MIVKHLRQRLSNNDVIGDVLWSMMKIISIIDKTFFLDILFTFSQVIDDQVQNLFSCYELIFNYYFILDEIYIYLFSYLLLYY